LTCSNTASTPQKQPTANTAICSPFAPVDICEDRSASFLTATALAAEIGCLSSAFDLVERVCPTMMTAATTKKPLTPAINIFIHKNSFLSDAK
jgi:hypothetical protein